jgi:hypothetical protein
MIPGQTTIEIFRGRARTWRAECCQDAAGTQPVNFTGCTAEAAIKLPDGTKIELAAAPVEEEGITLEDGWLEFSITDEDAALLTGTLYPWGCTVIDSLGDANPVLQGNVIVLVDTTL